MSTTRITLRLHQFELLSVVIAAAGLAGAAIAIGLLLKGVGLPLACLGDGALHEQVSEAVACAAPLRRFVEIDRGLASPFFSLMLAFPILAGLFVGVPAVAREIERGTAPLPWTLDGSRWRWLAIRSAILATVLIASFVPLALATDWLEGARWPLVDPSTSFGDEGVRGILLIARVLAGFAIGLIVGLALGRQLPGLIVGVVLGATVLVGATVGMDAWSEAVAIVRPVGEARVGDKAIATRLRAPDGRLYTFAQVDAMQPPRPDLPPDTVDEQWVQAHFEEVALLVPGSRYTHAVALQVALLVGGSAVVIGSCLLMIERRRPA
jgi:hypothetical protein